MRIAKFIFFIFCILLSTSKVEGNDYLNNPTPLNFENTLLIINYNHPHYGSIPFLQEMYSKVFPHIVFYGEKAHPDVIQMETNFGWWGQNVLADAMVRWPDFQGYICVQDDCWMNFWNFARLDKNKIWFTSNSLGILPLHCEHHPWPWWNNPWGCLAMTQAFHKLPIHYKMQLMKNVGAESVGFIWSDFVYIPARFRESYVELCQYFSDPNAFVELAIPTILCCLDDREEWEQLNVTWGLNNLSNDYNTNYDWLHPIKFSSQENKDFIRVIMEYWNSKQVIK